LEENIRIPYLLTHARAQEVYKPSILSEQTEEILQATKN
jgi:hypothetical protein